jgi:hypothetical protein
VVCRDGMPRLMKGRGDQAPLGPGRLSPESKDPAGSPARASAPPDAPRRRPLEGTASCLCACGVNRLLQPRPM